MYVYIECILTVIYYLPYPTFTHLNITIIISIHISPWERTHSFSLLGEIMRPLTEEILMQPEPLSFFSPTDSFTDATAQQTAGAQPYQQAKEVPLLQTKAWQLTVMHRLDFSDNLLFAPPTSPCNLPHTRPTRDASWGEHKSLLTHWKFVRGIFVVKLSCMSNLSVRSLGQ